MENNLYFSIKKEIFAIFSGVFVFLGINIFCEQLQPIQNFTQSGFSIANVYMNWLMHDAQVGFFFFKRCSCMKVKFSLEIFRIINMSYTVLYWKKNKDEMY